MLPVVNNSGAICNSWKLDPATLRFPLRGMLPYDKVTHPASAQLHVHTGINGNGCFGRWVQDLFEPQTVLLRYVLEQPYSREMVCNMLGLNKQVKNRMKTFLICFLWHFSMFYTTFFLLDLTAPFGLFLDYENFSSSVFLCSFFVCFVIPLKPITTWIPL